MSELSSTTGSYLLAVVLYKEIPVAFCTALYENGELLIERLFVDEDRRLGEIGKTLYEALVALSEPTYIKAFCVNGNNKGAAFFESIGFVMSPTESSRRCKVFEKKPQQEDFILNEIPENKVNVKKVTDLISASLARAKSQLQPGRVEVISEVTPFERDPWKLISSRFVGFELPDGYIVPRMVQGLRLINPIPIVSQWLERVLRK